MIVELPALIVPPGVEMHIDVGYDNDREDFFISAVELGKNALEVTKLQIISPKGLPIDILSYGSKGTSVDRSHPTDPTIMGTFLTKGSRVALIIKNPTKEDVKIEGFLNGYGIPSSLPFDPETKARIYRAFSKHIDSVKNIFHFLKESIFLK
jgi:hypothetical protein